MARLGGHPLTSEAGVGGQVAYGPALVRAPAPHARPLRPRRKEVVIMRVKPGGHFPMMGERRPGAPLGSVGYTADTGSLDTAAWWDFYNS